MASAKPIRRTRSQHTCCLLHANLSARHPHSHQTSLLAPLLSCHLKQLLHQTRQSWLHLQAGQAGHSKGITGRGSCSRVRTASHQLLLLLLLWLHAWHAAHACNSNCRWAFQLLRRGNLVCCCRSRSAAGTATMPYNRPVHSFLQNSDRGSAAAAISKQCDKSHT